MGAESVNLIEGLHKEMDRARQMIKNAESIGVAGTFYISICNLAIKKAEYAIESGDTVQMMNAYKELESLKGRLKDVYAICRTCGKIKEMRPQDSQCSDCSIDENQPLGCKIWLTIALIVIAGVTLYICLFTKILP